MFAKLFNTVAAISLAALLAGGGFVGYLFGTGKLTGARLEVMAGVLRGEFDGLPVSPEATDHELVTEKPPEEPRARTADEVAAIRKREHLEMLQTERAARDLEAQRRLLDHTLQHVVQEQERLANEKSAFVEQRQKIREAAHDEGFQKELGIVTGLQPRQAKEHILQTWRDKPADAIRLLNAMDERDVKRILDQFKTAEELQIMTDLLEQIRLQGMEGSANASRRTDGAAP